MEAVTADEATAEVVTEVCHNLLTGFYLILMYLFYQVAVVVVVVAPMPCPLTTDDGDKFSNILISALTIHNMMVAGYP